MFKIDAWSARRSQEAFPKRCGIRGFSPAKTEPKRPAVMTHSQRSSYLKPGTSFSAPRRARCSPRRKRLRFANRTIAGRGGRLAVDFCFHWRVGMRQADLPERTFMAWPVDANIIIMAEDEPVIIGFDALASFHGQAALAMLAIVFQGLRQTLDRLSPNAPARRSDISIVTGHSRTRPCRTARATRAP